MFQGLESDRKITEDALRRQIEDLKKKLKEKEWCLEAQVGAWRHRWKQTCKAV